MNERQGKNGGGEALCDVLYQRITSSTDEAIKVALGLVDEADIKRRRRWSLNARHCLRR